MGEMQMMEPLGGGSTCTPARKVPVPKPARRVGLQPVDGVPNVNPEALQRRLDFLLSPAAAEMQMMERRKEAELKRREIEERKRRKQSHLQRVGEDMKRRAILKDRKRIETKVSEAMEMARRSKMKRAYLYWCRRMENLSKFVVSAENFEEEFKFAGAPGQAEAQRALPDLDAGAGTTSGVLLSRNVSVPFLLRQLGGAKAFPQQKSRRIPMVHNVFRDTLESSYDLLPEDAPRFEPEPAGPNARDRAFQLYSGFSEQEKMSLLQVKIDMLKARQKDYEDRGITPDHLTVRLIDTLEATQKAAEEQAQQEHLKGRARDARGVDPAGLPPKSRAFDFEGRTRGGST